MTWFRNILKDPLTAFSLLLQCLAGFLGGAVLASLLELASLGQWTILMVSVVACVLVVGALWLWDTVLGGLVDRLFSGRSRWWKGKVARETKKAGFIAAGIGVVIALVVTRFVPASAILSAL